MEGPPAAGAHLALDPGAAGLDPLAQGRDLLLGERLTVLGHLRVGSLHDLDEEALFGIARCEEVTREDRRLEGEISLGLLSVVAREAALFQERGDVFAEELQSVLWSTERREGEGYESGEHGRNQPVPGPISYFWTVSRTLDWPLGT